MTPNYLKTSFDLDSEELINVLDELPLWSAPFGLKLLDKIKLKKAIKALDIGFGVGFPLTELAMRLGQSSTVYGIDPWEAAINRTKKKIALYGIRNVKIIKGQAESIPLDNQSIDLIVSNNGLNNVTDQEQSLSECSRITKAGGQLVQTVNLNNSMATFYDILEKVLKSKGLDKTVDAMYQHIDQKRKPLDKLTEQLEQHGFKLNEITEHEFAYRFVDGTSMLNHYFIRLAFLAEWTKLIAESRQTEIFKDVEQQMNAEAQQNGEFKLNIPFVVIDSQKI